ncbi:MAG: 3-phosphoshikimate 1-carboxyvinyltransferase [Spirosomataceae bacterium]
MESILLKKNTQSFKVQIPLASSKSESNRALIINALTGFKSDIQNLSTARDTQTMIRLLQSTDKIADVLDAGTTMRFLTAYYSATNQNKVMTGTPRMQERPIGILVEALREIGVKIEYLNKEGYPPHEIKDFNVQKSNKVSIRGDVSSQYISALLMIAPILPQGLTIDLTGEIGSKPYIEMTIAQMRQFGAEVDVDWANNSLKVSAKPYQISSFKVESDWSGASYWYSIVALAENEDCEVELLGLKENSLQGDSAIVQIMSQLGVKSTFNENGVILTKIPSTNSLEWDFTNCPDLAQTVSVCCAAKGVEAIFTGIESLKIKETDRVVAIQNELKKFGGDMVEIETNHKYQIKPFAKEVTENQPIVSIHTYDDHRMAMAFAPLSMIMDVVIEEPNVVVKSYPSYWDDLKKIVTIE